MLKKIIILFLILLFFSFSQANASHISEAFSPIIEKINNWKLSSESLVAMAKCEENRLVDIATIKILYIEVQSSVNALISRLIFDLQLGDINPERYIDSLAKISNDVDDFKDCIDKKCWLKSPVETSVSPIAVAIIGTATGVFLSELIGYLKKHKFDKKEREKIIEILDKLKLRGFSQITPCVILEEPLIY